MIFRNLNVSLFESSPVWGNKAANFQSVGEYMSQLPPSTDLVLLPELFSTGFIATDFDAAVSLREPDDGPTIAELRRLAAQHNAAIAGSFIGEQDGYLRNRAFFIEPGGDTTFYNKRHLFTMASEQVTYRPGSEPAPVVRFRGMNFKLITCYDLRFPVFCRNRREEYDVLLVVANWPVARQRAWHTLLQARAIENLCYVCAVNRAGTDMQGVDYGTGSSAVVDFKGRPMPLQAKDVAGARAFEATLSREELTRFREKFPAHRDADTFRLLL